MKTCPMRTAASWRPLDPSEPLLGAYVQPDRRGEGLRMSHPIRSTVVAAEGQGGSITRVILCPESALRKPCLLFSAFFCFDILGLAEPGRTNCPL